MDPRPTFPNGWHPQTFRSKPNLNGHASYYTRTARPTKYFLIDFGISRKYEPSNKSPREYPIWGGDKTVPEFQHSDDAQDPFPTDIYYLGNMIREDFLQVSHERWVFMPANVRLSVLRNRDGLSSWSTWSPT